MDYACLWEIKTHYIKHIKCKVRSPSLWGHVNFRSLIRPHDDFASRLSKGINAALNI